MKLLNVVLFAAMAAAAAIPMPLDEADVENLRARGVSEADIAHALHPSPANPVASLLRRNIDADGEVQPSHYLSPHPHLTRRWDSAGDVSAVEHDDSLTPARREHKLAIVRFMDGLMSGRLRSIAAGTGGTALRKRDAAAEKRGYVGDGASVNRFWSFGAMTGGMPRIMRWKGSLGSHGANSNADANGKALTTTTTNLNANANSAAMAISDHNAAIEGPRAPQEELTRPERWVYRW